jgi:hypothetical protein
VLTSFVPGQEKGNAEFVTEAGAGVYAPRPRQLAAEIGRLRRDPAALAAMRDASARAGRPSAAVDIARFIADLVQPAEVGSRAELAAAAAPAGGDGESADWPSELLPALMAETSALARPLVFSLTDVEDSEHRARASSSLRRLRRSGVLIRAALRDR